MAEFQLLCDRGRRNLPCGLLGTDNATNLLGVLLRVTLVSALGCVPSAYASGHIWPLPTFRHASEAAPSTTHNGSAQISSASVLTLTGCIVPFADAYFIVQDNTRTIFQLEGDRSTVSFWGKHVRILGASRDTFGHWAGVAPYTLTMLTIPTVENWSGSCRQAQSLVSQAASRNSPVPVGVSPGAVGINPTAFLLTIAVGVATAAIGIFTLRTLHH
jgi:hypothetical protein